MKNIVLGILGTSVLAGGVFVVMPQLTTVSYTANVVSPAQEARTPDGMTTELAEVEVVDNRVEVKHQPLPAQVKAVYMTACVVGTPTFRDSLVKFIEETEANAVMIDVKDYSGTISFPPEAEELKPAWQSAKCGSGDIRDFIASLHEKGIYVIARITVFQDPHYTSLHPDLAVKKADGVSTWHDYKGLAFIDVGARPYWDYLVMLARDSYNAGFDELNFDYVRYPSDGPMSDISFTHSAKFPGDNDKQANLETFFKYLNEKLDDEKLFADYNHTNTGRASSTPWTSADLFGMTTTNFDDLSIGQVQDRAAPYFDFIAPMVYPSHYPDSFLGLGNPNNYPYKVVNFAMQAGVNRMVASTTPMQGFLHTPINTTNASGTATFSGKYTKPVYTADKLRTWIQDFDYGGDYDAADVRAEIQASYDAGVMSWMIWAPSNIYTRAALKAPGFMEVSE